MNSNYKQEEIKLKKLFSDNVSSTMNLRIELLIYYKNRKLSNPFIKNNPFNDPRESHVVYKYICPKTEFQPSKFYIGYTTTTLNQRMTIHAQNILD